MRKRQAMSRKKSRRDFRTKASGTHRKNVSSLTGIARGGVRL